MFKVGDVLKPTERLFSSSEDARKHLVANETYIVNDVGKMLGVIPWFTVRHCSVRWNQHGMWWDLVEPKVGFTLGEIE
jgi:hypothetical protein